ncbi:MAG: hypothetical protein AAB408_01755 [Patescibacteria group bacterium]
MYLFWDEKTITDFSDANINALYNQGYVFTRKGKGTMNQTRSLRIDLSQFELSSENRRILKKNEHLQPTAYNLQAFTYHWSIGKLAKDFYDTKFGPGTFSANKVKELMTDPAKSNFNRVFVYTIDKETIGYAIALETNDLIHYSYPFYNLLIVKGQMSNVGLGMMLRAILYAKEHGKKYIYLGSATRPTDVYKLQFSGLEWFDGERWKNDLLTLKNLLSHP